MTEIIISSATKEVVLGFDHPFVIIDERISPAGGKLLTAEMAAGDYSRVEKMPLRRSKPARTCWMSMRKFPSRTSHKFSLNRRPMP